MAQKLIMPFKSQMMYCGYKNTLYKNYWGYPHYGIDLSSKKAGSDDNIYASGDGVVIAAGKDDSLGWGIVVRYDECIGRDNGVKDLAVKYMHLSDCKVKKGDKVQAGDILGVEGKEGTEDYHLHLEVDTDTDYPRWTPQVSAGHTFWMKGIDTTLNPSLWLYVGAGQEIVEPIYNPAWLNAEDMDIPRLEEKNMSEISKLPINENVPLENDEFELHGDPVWAWIKKGKWLYLFDKYWRKVPTKSSDYAAEFASEEAWENAHLATAEEKATVTEGITDNTNYDHLFGIEELPEDITPDVPNDGDTEAEKLPTNSDDIAKGIASMIKSLEYFAKALGVYDKVEKYR